MQEILRNCLNEPKLCVTHALTTCLSASGRHANLRERIPNRGATVRGLTPLEVQEIYAVREELEVMAVRIIPFPVAPADIGRLEELQRQHH